MKIIAPKFPWCTVAPRPVLLSCADADEVTISYYVCPAVESGVTAVLTFSSVTSVRHQIVNDTENELLDTHPRFQRDMIHFDGRTTWLLFHNEYFEIVGKLAIEEISELHNTENVERRLCLEMNREP